MKMHLDCFPCFMRQALKAARMATVDVSLQREVLDRVAQLLPTIPSDATPVEIGQRVHRTVREVTGVADPYREAKKRSNDLALELYPELKRRVDGSRDRLLTAVKIAAAGNIIDYGPDHAIDLQGSLAAALTAPLAPAAYRAFQGRLARVDRVLYIGDNAGEIVYDMILIEELVALGKNVTFVVRGESVLNDVTLEDAEYIGLNRLARIITTGSDAPGIVLSDASPGFLSAFRSAPLIISKGQGNYEGLSGVEGPIYFLFKVKCPVIARDAGAEIGEIVFKQGGKHD